MEFKKSKKKLTLSEEETKTDSYAGIEKQMATKNNLSSKQGMLSLFYGLIFFCFHLFQGTLIKTLWVKVSKSLINAINN